MCKVSELQYSISEYQKTMDVVLLRHIETGKYSLRIRLGNYHCARCGEIHGVLCAELLRKMTNIMHEIGICTQGKDIPVILFHHARSEDDIMNAVKPTILSTMIPATPDYFYRNTLPKDLIEFIFEFQRGKIYE